MPDIDQLIMYFPFGSRPYVIIMCWFHGFCCAVESLSGFVQQLRNSSGS